MDSFGSEPLNPRLNHLLKLRELARKNGSGHSYNKILDHAAIEFAEQGIDKTSVSKIMTMAHAGHDAFYKYFRLEKKQDSIKPDLVLLLIYYRRTKIRNTIQSCLKRLPTMKNPNDAQSLYDGTRTMLGSAFIALSEKGKLDRQLMPYVVAHRINYISSMDQGIFNATCEAVRVITGYQGDIQRLHDLSRKLVKLIATLVDDFLYGGEIPNYAELEHTYTRMLAVFISGTMELPQCIHCEKIREGTLLQQLFNKATNKNRPVTETEVTDEDWNPNF